MNNLKQITTSLLVIISLCCCSKEDGGTKDSEKETIENKWIVSNSTEFKSIEFDSNGNYIITKNRISGTSKIKETEEIVVLGTYEILDTDIFLLSDFGTVKFDDSDPNHIKFSIMYEGSNTYTYELNVTKAEIFVSTPQTDLLCNTTWKYNRKSQINDTISLINFSKAGTCYANFSITSQNKGVSIQLGKWKWFDSQENKIIISKMKTEWIIDNDGEAEFEVTKLNSTSFELKETYNNIVNTTAFDTINVIKPEK